MLTPPAPIAVEDVYLRAAVRILHGDELTACSELAAQTDAPKDAYRWLHIALTSLPQGGRPRSLAGMAAVLAERPRDLWPGAAGARQAVLDLLSAGAGEEELLESLEGLWAHVLGVRRGVHIALRDVDELRTCLRDAQEQLTRAGTAAVEVARGLAREHPGPLSALLEDATHVLAV